MKWYDHKTEIEHHVKTLDGFLKLIHERHIAGYERKERLEQWLVLGRYSLDTCGNCMLATKDAPKDSLPYIPDVMQYDEAWKYIKRFDKTGVNESVTFSYGSGLPHVDTICPVCKQGWNIHNCYDTKLQNEDKTFSLAEYVGKTLADVKTSFAKKTDAVYSVQFERFLQNERFVDKTLKYPNPENDWEKTAVKNENGWADRDVKITDDYVIQSGDSVAFNVRTYFHKACNRKHLAAQEEEKFFDVFAKAGFKKIEMLPIPNGYCPCDVCAPWFEVTTEIGKMTIGWRKRVINLEWAELPRMIDIAPMFMNEDVTKWDKGIHAWGYDKAVEYLTKIRESYGWQEASE